MPDRIIRRLDGKRGGFLFILGCWWAAFGVGNILEPSTESRIMGFAWLPNYLNADELGWVWVLAAAVALTAALNSGEHPRWENAGFGALMVPPVMWVLIFVVALWKREHPTAWIPIIIYSAFASIIWFCASWPNPIERSPEREAALLADPPVSPEQDETEGGGEES